MVNLRQSITTLFGGVSTQPPSLRPVNQVTAADNVLFSVRDDASKRPGMEHLFEIDSLTADGVYRLHPIDRDENEQYLLLYGDSTIRIFTLAGVEATLTTSPDAQTYLDANNATAAEMRLVSMADYSILVNTTVTTAVQTSDAYTITGTYTDYNVMTATRPARYSYWKTKNDSIGYPKGYFQYDGGASTYPSMLLKEVANPFTHPESYASSDRNPGGFKIGMDKLVLSGTAVVYLPAAKSLYKTAAFTAHTHQAGDKLRVTGGTGPAPGWFAIASKTSANLLVMTDAIHTVNVHDLAADCAGLQLTFTDGGYVATTKTLTKTAAFAAFTLTAGDKIYLSAGTGITPGWYAVATRVSDDAITLSTSAGTNSSDVAATAIGTKLTLTAGAYIVAADTLYKTDLFDAYTFVAADQINVTGGTGLTPDIYTISAKPDDHTVTLSSAPGAAATADATIAGIIGTYSVIIDFSDQTFTTMDDVAAAFQSAIQDAGADDALVSWTLTKHGVANVSYSRGRFTVYGQAHGAGASLYPCTTLGSGYNWAADNRPFSGSAGDYTITQGAGDPAATVPSIYDSWVRVAAPSQEEAEFVQTTMPIQITRESTGGGVEKVYNEIIVDDTPYYYWRLGEASGTVAVDEMEHCDGTYTATPTLGVAGAITGDANTAVTFNGTTEFVDVQVYPVQLGPTLHSTGWSISLWFKTSDTSATSRRMISLQEAETLILWDYDFFGVSINSQGYLGCYSRGYFHTPDEPLNQILDSKPAHELQDGDWHHLVVTVTPATGSVPVRFYIDGALYGTDTATSAEALRTWHHIHHVYIGCDHNQIQGKFWNGTLDEVAIYERPLTAAEIAEEYAARVDVVSGGPTFNIDVIDWKPRLSGDEETNPVPSFVGKKLSDVSFHRNRLALLGGENEVLSAAGDFFNFFIEDADNIADADPIDVAMSSDRVTIGDFMVPFRKSMVIFTLAGQQFELNAPEVLTGATASLTASTRYDSIIGVRPAVMGTQVYFPSIAPHGAQIREYLYDDSALANIAADITAHVEGYIPATVCAMEACPNFNTLYVLPEDGYHIYAYRAYWRGTEKVQSSWSRIVLDDEDRIVDIAALRNNLYVLAEVGSEYHVLCLPVERESAPTGASFMPLLDNWKLITGTYSAGTGLTTFTQGFDDAAVTEIVKGGGWTTTAGVALTATKASAGTLTVVGDYSAYPCYVGRPYTMSLTLSRPYQRDQEGGAVLDAGMMLHVLSLTHNESGPYTVTVAMPGYSNYSESFAPASGLTDASGETRFWIRGQADDTTVTITASGHTPCTIVCGEWESTFAPRAM